jgi:two-component system nitrogen regulation sensor histidine kinase NtrY
VAEAARPAKPASSAAPSTAAGQLRNQQTAGQANLELDGRRRFTELVLSGVSAGVSASTTRAHHAARRSASSCSPPTWRKGGPPLADIVRKWRNSPPPRLCLNRMASARSTSFAAPGPALLVRVVAEDKASGWWDSHVTFDDVLRASVGQRKAAWADVARASPEIRIATRSSSPPSG